MQLSRTRIIGPKYSFSHGANNQLFVNYQNKGQNYSIPISLIQKGSQESLTVQTERPLERPPNKTFMYSISTTLNNTFIHEDLRGTGLAYVLLNITLFHMLKTLGEDPSTINVNSAINTEGSSFASFILLHRFGITRLEESEIQHVLISFKWATKPTQITNIDSKRFDATRTLKFYRRKLFFIPNLPPSTMLHLTRDLVGLEYLLRLGYAYLSECDYFITDEAAAIMPDYVKLLPENPTVTLA